MDEPTRSPAPPTPAAGRPAGDSAATHAPQPALPGTDSSRSGASAGTADHRDLIAPDPKSAGPRDDAKVWDLAVVGGGPAGAMAAWRAASLGLRVVVLERGRVPRDKVCGAFVSAEALPLLAMAAPELVARAPRLSRVEWISAAGRRCGFGLPQPGLGIARADLDAALLMAAARAGAEVRTSVTAAAWRPERREIGCHPRGAGPLVWLRARAVVLAAGRWWRIAGLNGAEAERTVQTGAGEARRGAPGWKRRREARQPITWVGIHARIEGLGCGHLEMYAFSGGYCGLAPTTSGINICALARGGVPALSGCRDLLAWLAARSPALAARLSPAALASPVQVTAPVYLGENAPRRTSVFCAGDAAGFADPFTGSGLARAILGGALAAEMAAQAMAGDGDLTRAAAAHAAKLATATRRARRISNWLRGFLTAAEPWQGWAGWLLARGPIGRAFAARTRWDLAAARPGT